MNAPVVFGHPMAVEPLPWALVRIRAARAIGPIPLYGTDEWAALPARDLRSFGAVIAAAEAARDYRSAERVALDLAADEDTFIRRMKAASADVSSAADWSAIASQPTHAELANRRAS